MKTMMRCLVMILFVGTISTQVMAQWEPANGPVGPCVFYQVSISQPSGDLIMLVATSSGIYRSTNEGDSWILIVNPKPLMYAVKFTVIYPTQSTPIVFANCGDLIKSTDYGLTWSSVQTYPGSRVDNITHSRTALYVLSKDTIYVSYDFGETWTNRNKLPYTGNTVYGIWHFGEKIYASLNDNTIGTLFVSANDGVSWSNTGLLGVYNMFSLVTINNDTILFAQSWSSGDPLYRSKDLGNNWTSINMSGEPALTTYFTEGNNLYRVKENILSRSTDLGEIWTSIGTLPIGPTLGWAGQKYLHGQRIFIAGWKGVCYSIDSGTKWNIANKGLFLPLMTNGESGIGSINLVATNGNISILEYHGWYFESPSSSMYISTNAQKEWKLITPDLGREMHISDVVFDGTDIFVLYGFMSSALTFDAKNSSRPLQYCNFIKSSDSGRTWIDFMNGPNCRSFMVHEGTYYAGEFSDDNTNRGIYLSIDNGMTWQKKNTGLSDSSVYAFALIHEQNMHYVFAGTRIGVFITSNNGNNWALTGQGPKRVISLATKVTQSGTTFIFAGTDSSGVLRSSDRGASWYSANAGPKMLHISKIITTDKYIFSLSSDFISKGGGVFCSSDNGSTWQTVNGLLPDDRISDIAVTDSVLFASVNENGLWSLPLSSIVLDVRNTKINIALNEFILAQNYPNPFNPSTTIRYSVPERSNVRLSIFNTLGQKISEIVNETKDAGSYEQSINASQLSSGISAKGARPPSVGLGYASGVYFYRIEATSTQNSGKTFMDTKKMVLIR
ncbi:MAG: T9SS type A sorting domain-containing protein [Bacteroidota bacterium]